MLRRFHGDTRSHGHREPYKTRGASAENRANDDGALKRLLRLIRDCLPLLLAVAGYPSRAEREHQQREYEHREPHPER